MYVNFRAYFQTKFAYVITSVERYWSDYVL